MNAERKTEFATRVVDDLTGMTGDDVRERQIAIVEAYVSSFTDGEEATALREAVGMGLALHPKLEMDPDDPVAMMKLAVEHVTGERIAANSVIDAAGALSEELSELGDGYPLINNLLATVETLENLMGPEPEIPRVFVRPDPPPPLPFGSTEGERAEPRFEAIYQVIKQWDIDADGKGYCGGNGSHVAAIMQAIDRSREGVDGLRETVTDFMAKWMMVAPLVRASSAVGIWQHVERYIRSAADMAMRERASGMDRRARVTALHAIADGHLADFLAQLANLADAEAEKTGIDADIRYQADSGMDPFVILASRQHERSPSRPKHPHLDKGWAADAGKEIAEAITHGAQATLTEELDREALRDLEKTVGAKRCSKAVQGKNSGGEMSEGRCSLKEGHESPCGMFVDAPGIIHGEDPELFDRGEGLEEMPPEEDK